MSQFLVIATTLSSVAVFLWWLQSLPQHDSHDGSNIGE